LKCETASDLKKLCLRLPGDPLVLKAYTERALASLLSRWAVLESEGKIPESFKTAVTKPEVKFADLSVLNHASIRSYVLEVLECVADQGDDAFVKAFCEHRSDGEASMFPPYDITEMMFSNAFAFPGLTLVADDDPAGRMLEMSSRLLEHMPKAKDLENDIAAQERAATAVAKQAAKAKKGSDGDDNVPQESSQVRLNFRPELVIKSAQFLKHWCPSRPADAPHIARVLPTVQEFMQIKDLPIDERWQMLALAGAGAFDPTLNKDESKPVYTQWVLESMNLNRLACVTAGKEFTWGANVPASTVVVTKSFAETTSVAGMLQYVGRAARRGLTTHGQAIFERNEDLERIFASPDGLSTEAHTMERYAQWWLSGGKKW